MVILLSKSSLKDNYSAWIEGLSPETELIDIYSYPKERCNELIQECSGILLTGGSDINPGLYNESENYSRCEGIDDRRDQTEIALARAAFEKKIPLLAICRGIQLINVYFKGTLIIDIPSEVGCKVEHRNKNDVFHSVRVLENSALGRLVNDSKFTVNSSHHQAVRSLGPGLVPVAWSEDDIIEAVELSSELSHPFFTGIQWHPERMDVSNPLSGKLGRAFLQCAELSMQRNAMWK